MVIYLPSEVSVELFFSCCTTLSEEYTITNKLRKNKEKRDSSSNNSSSRLEDILIVYWVLLWAWTIFEAMFNPGDTKKLGCDSERIWVGDINSGRV